MGLLTSTYYIHCIVGELLAVSRYAVRVWRAHEEVHAACRAVTMMTCAESSDTTTATPTDTTTATPTPCASEWAAFLRFAREKHDTTTTPTTNSTPSTAMESSRCVSTCAQRHYAVCGYGGITGDSKDDIDEGRGVYDCVNMANRFVSCVG